MGLSLKQRIKYHQKRQVQTEPDRNKRYFSIGFVSGANLFAPGQWREAERKAIVKEKFNVVKTYSTYKNPSLAERDELNKAKGLIAYVKDLKDEKAKKGLTLFDKEIKGGQFYAKR